MEGAREAMREEGREAIRDSSISRFALPVLRAKSRTMFSIERFLVSGNMIQVKAKETIPTPTKMQKA